MNRLALQIYLGFVLVLIAFFAMTSVWFRAFETQEDSRFEGTAERVAALLVPEAGASLEAHQIAAEKLAAATQTGVVIFHANGKRLGEAGEFVPLPDFDREGSHFGRRRRGSRTGVLQLEDGRRLAILAPEGGPTPFHGLAVLGLGALALAAGSYPVARRIAGRLERLSASVDAWGSGDLGIRATPEGKDEVAQLAKRFNQAAERVETLVGAQRTLLASASHELRSPLARLRMAAEILAEGSLEDEARIAQLRAQLTRDIAALDAGVEELLLVSRLDLMAAEDAWAEVDLLAIAAEEGARAEADHDIEVELSGVSLLVQGHDRSLRHMMRNLIANAIRHAPGSAVEVVVEAGLPGHVVLEVRDRGPGFSEADRARIFEPFVRGESSEQGLGLGLAIVQQIAVHHGGSAEALPREGGGAMFRIEFPESS